MTLRYSFCGCLCVAAWLCTISNGHAAFTFLGPTPYLGAADSPFAKHLGSPNFFLEDFEDGELNTPGIGQIDFFPPEFGGAFVGNVLPPGPLTDSVDADDGLSDGNGHNGHSFRSGVNLVVDIFPPIHTFQFAFEFDSEALGYLPNLFGVVWTDGPPGSTLSLLITTGTGEIVSSEVIRGLGDESRDGRTSEYRFVGVIMPSGIAEVIVRGGFVGEIADSAYIEIDHLQYGHIVPEPRITVLIGWLLYGACSSRTAPIRRPGGSMPPLTRINTTSRWPTALPTSAATTSTANGPIPLAEQRQMAR